MSTTRETEAAPAATIQIETVPPAPDVQNVPQIFLAIPAIMGELSAVKKGKTTQEGARRFAYRGIDDVMNAMWPLLSKHKVFVVPEVIDQQREERQTTKGGTLLYSILRIRFTFYAADGSSIQAVTVGEGMDSGDKASNKAMAVALKYALFQTFCIPTEEMAGDDPDGQVHEVRPQNRAASQRQTSGNRPESHQGQNYPRSGDSSRAGANNAAHGAAIGEAHVAALQGRAWKKNISLQSLANSYGAARLEDLSIAQWQDAMNRLESYPDRRPEEGNR